MKKKIFFISLIFLGISIFTIPKIITEGQEFKVVFFDVGQGDAALIKIPNRHLILIDGGPDNKVLRGLGKNIPFYQRKIDFIIISHWHDDHVIGLVEVLKRFQIKTLIFMEGGYQGEITREVLEVAQKQKTKIVTLKNELNINYSNNCFLTLLNPLSLGVRENENNSIVTQLSCQGMKFLFSGDNELAVEKALLHSNRDWQTNIFKASHHGSKTSNTKEFLEMIKPDLVVVSVGENNKFDHPSPEVLATFSELSLRVKRTDQLGDITIWGNNNFVK